MTYSVGNHDGWPFVYVCETETNINAIRILVDNEMMDNISTETIYIYIDLYLKVNNYIY